MKAHDVRHLRICSHCRGLGDNRQMITGLHDECFAAIHADNIVQAVLALPQTESDKLTIGAIGTKAMIALLDAPR